MHFAIRPGAEEMTLAPNVAGIRRGGRVLRIETDGISATISVCDRCDRRMRVCRDCPAPVVGRIATALRCTLHRRRSIRTSIRASVARKRGEIASHQKAYRANPKCGNYLGYKRRRRKANPEKIHAQKRRAAAAAEGRARLPGALSTDYRLDELEQRIGSRDERRAALANPPVPK